MGGNGDILRPQIQVRAPTPDDIAQVYVATGEIAAELENEEKPTLTQQALIVLLRGQEAAMAMQLVNIARQRERVAVPRIVPPNLTRRF